ncbi:MAG: hypothetical protein U1E47_01265 [Rivihabitans pingtungensis]
MGLWDALDVPPASMNVMMGGHQPEITVPASSWRERLRRGLSMLRYLRRAGAVRQRGEAAIVRVRAMAQRHCAPRPSPATIPALRAALQEAGQVARSEFDMFFLQELGRQQLVIAARHPGKSLSRRRRRPGRGAAGRQRSSASCSKTTLLALAQQARPGRPCVNGVSRWRILCRPYGHRGHYEAYFRSAGWREQPDNLLAQLDSLADIDADAAPAPATGRRASWARIRQHAPWPTRLLLRWLAR